MARRPDFLVDTSILIAHLRQSKSPTVFDAARTRYGIAATSDIVVFELEVGARRAGRELEFQREFQPMQSFPLTQSILIQAADLQAQLLTDNAIIGLLDTFLGATALEHNLPLLTLNHQHFQRIPDLTLMDLPKR